jgi:hypothetical protein
MKIIYYPPFRFAVYSGRRFTDVSKRRTASILRFEESAKEITSSNKGTNRLLYFLAYSSITKTKTLNVSWTALRQSQKTVRFKHNN